MVGHFSQRLPPQFTFFSDTAGCGAFQTDGRWFQLPWPDFRCESSIAIMELIPVVVVAAI